MDINGLGVNLEGFLEPLLGKFVEEGSTFAAGLAMILIGTAATLLILQGIIRIFPAWLALTLRSNAVHKALKGAKTPEECRHKFAESFADKIDPALSSGFDNPPSQWTRRILTLLGVERPLQLAWSELKETFVDESDEDVIKNTARPHSYVMRAVSNPARWAWLSGFFVSIGLFFTFIGIIAVLQRAGIGLAGDTQDFDQTRQVIVDIVSGAASKFYASIGGLAGAILFRFFLSVYSGLLKQRAERLSDLLESGLAYVPEQRLIQDQLEQLSEQTVQLKKFNTDLAVSIGDRFDQALAPVATSLGDIKNSFEEQSQRTMQVLGEGVGQAIDNIAGGEIRELGRVLGDLKSELSGMSDKLSAGGDAAASQLEQAASQLKGVSEGFQKEFEHIAGRLNELSKEQSDRVTATLESLVTTSQEATAGISNGVSDAVGKLAGSLNETIQKLDAAGERNAATLKEMADGLSALTSDVGTEARSKMNEALGLAAEDSRKAAAEAAEAMRSAYSEASESWVSSLDESLLKLEGLRDGFDAARSAVSTHADAMTSAASNTKSAADALSRSASGLENIAGPIAAASTQLQSASEAVKSAVESLTAQAGTAVKSAEDLIEGLQETSDAAEEAWTAYQDRFEQVDEDLEKVLVQMSQALDQNAKRLTEYVSEVDGQLAKAVENLSGVVKPLTDLADELETAIRNIQSVSKDAES
jgi:ABC-type transporter Mla subunit MlaD